MPSYTVIFRTSAESVTGEFFAETPEQALAFARVAYEDCPDIFRLDPVDQPLAEIAVRDAKGYERAIWQSADRRLRNAANDLLHAAEDVIARWEHGDLAEAVRVLNAVLVRAKGDRPEALVLLR